MLSVLTSPLRLAATKTKVLFVLIVCSFASSCGTSPADRVNASADADACAIKKPPQARDDKGFLNKKNQREVAYCGSTWPRLWTGEEARKGHVIDATKVNFANRKANGRSRTGFVSALDSGGAADQGGDSELAGAERVYAQEIRAAGARNFKPDERVTINFENRSLDFFVRQMMGGVLGVNYMASNPLTGTVTFRTEQPVPKAQVIPIVRDVLGRNGLVMKFMNGVYHIGDSATVDTIERASVTGRAGEAVTRVIRLNKNVTAELGEVLTQIVPAGTTVLLTPTGDGVVVRASPEDIGKVEGLIRALTESRIGRDLMAIVPLAESPPARVARMVNEFLAARSASGSPLEATIIPLESQLSVLIGTKGKKTMASIRTLVYKLDRDHGDGSDLRIVPLKFLSAQEVAQQLSGMFGDGGEANASAEPIQVKASGRASSVRSQSGNSGSQSAGIRAPALFNGDVEAEAGPRDTSLAPGADGDGPDRSGPAPGRVVPARTSVASNVSIIADVRNNALLIHSPFKVFKRIKDVVEVLDVPLAQVVIEATIAEVEINDKLQYGVQTFLEGNGFAVRSSKAPAPEGALDPGNPGGVSTIAKQFLGKIPGLGGINVQAVLTALQVVTNVKVISSPYLTVLDGKSARLVIGDQIPFSTRSQESNNDGTVTVTNVVETMDTGIIMTVAPKVRPDNSLLLNIQQEVSSAAASAEEGNLTPIIKTREISSDISVQSGRTVLLGGLIEERTDKTESGVPVLKEIPVFGELFKQTQDDNRRVELLVLITPRVIRKSSQIERLTDMLRNQMSTY